MNYNKSKLPQAHYIARQLVESYKTANAKTELNESYRPNSIVNAAIKAMFDSLSKSINTRSAKVEFKYPRPGIIEYYLKVSTNGGSSYLGVAYLNKGDTLASMVTHILEKIEEFETVDPS